MYKMLTKIVTFCSITVELSTLNTNKKKKKIKSSAAKLLNKLIIIFFFIVLFVKTNTFREQYLF